MTYMAINLSKLVTACVLSLLCVAVCYIFFTLRVAFGINKHKLKDYCLKLLILVHEFCLL